MKKILLIALVLAIAFGLLFILADTGKVAVKGQKKNASPRPSVSINPYAFPLPQMGSGTNTVVTGHVLIHH